MAGIPVVTTMAGAIAEVAKDGDTAFVLEPNDPPALRKGVETVLEDPQLARKLATSARQFVLEHHSEAVMVERMGTVFQNLQPLPGKR